MNDFDVKNERVVKEKDGVIYLAFRIPFGTTIATSCACLAFHDDHLLTGCNSIRRMQHHYCCQHLNLGEVKQ